MDGTEWKGAGMGGSNRKGEGKETHGRGTLNTKVLFENHIETKYCRNFL